MSLYWYVFNLKFGICCVAADVFTVQSLGCCVLQTFRRCVVSAEFGMCCVADG